MPAVAPTATARDSSSGEERIQVGDWGTMATTLVVFGVNLLVVGAVASVLLGITLYRQRDSAPAWAGADENWGLMLQNLPNDGANHYGVVPCVPGVPQEHAVQPGAPSVIMTQDQANELADLANEETVAIDLGEIQPNRVMLTNNPLDPSWVPPSVTMERAVISTSIPLPSVREETLRFLW